MKAQFSRTDQFNALKFGHGLLREEWPRFIETRLGIPIEKPPRIERTGEQAGALRSGRASEPGLSAGTPVAAGLTDG